MKSYTIAKGIIKAVLFFLILGMILFVLFRIRSLIVYIAMACVLSLLGRPVVLFLEKRFHIGKTYGAGITMLLVLALMVGSVAMFVPMLTEQGKNLAVYDFAGIQVELDKVYVKISEYSGTSKETIEKAVEEGTIEKDGTGEAEAEAVPTIMDTLLEILTQLSVGLFSVIFMAFFMLKDRNSLQRFFLAMIPPRHRPRAIESLDKTKNLCPDISWDCCSKYWSSSSFTRLPSFLWVRKTP